MKKIVLFLFALIISNVGFAQDPVMFDNSLPGEWESVIKITIDDGVKQISEKKVFKCIKKEDIDKANKKVLVKEFTNEKGFQCRNSFKRESKTRGLFSTSCQGKEDGQNVTSNTQQFLLSEKNKNEVLIKTENRKDGPTPLIVKTTIDIKSKLISENCSK